MTNQQKIETLAIFDISKTITLGAEMILDKRPCIFHLPFELCQLVYFMFSFPDLPNLIPRGLPFALGSGNAHLHDPEDI